MREDEAVDNFASMFQAGFAAEPERIEKRQRSERRSSLTAKQRKRGAVRTTQINYRCTPAYKQLASGALAKHCDASIADVMEEALALTGEGQEVHRGE